MRKSITKKQRNRDEKTSRAMTCRQGVWNPKDCGRNGSRCGSTSGIGLLKFTVADRLRVYGPLKFENDAQDIVQIGFSLGHVLILGDGAETRAFGTAQWRAGKRDKRSGESGSRVYGHVGENHVRESGSSHLICMHVMRL